MIRLFSIAVLIGVIYLPLVVASIRLPTTSVPLHYDLQLKIDVEEARYSGTVAIRLQVTSANVNLIALNYHPDVEVGEVLIYLASDNTQSNLLDRINPSPTTQIIQFLTNSTLITSSEYVISMDFEGAIRSDLKGLYMSSYWINGHRRNIATTFFAPHYARMVFPCYDEPNFKATFDVQITNDIKYHALANAAPKSYITNPENVTTSFERTPKMSTYLLAFIVSDLVASRDTSNNNQNLISVWSQESRKTATAFSLRYVHQVRTALEDYLGLPYQMNKLDLVAVDDFLMGAMENWGLITFASNRLLADDKDTTTAEQRGVVKIVSHEVTHQWFGNLVTCRWWNDIWLNEGFATYVEDVIADKVANQWLVLDQFVVAEKIPAMLKDSDRTNRKPMNQEVTTLDGISAIYDFVAYPKAASVLRMFHHVVGDQIFQQTLQVYLRTYQFANVERQNFFSVLEQVARQLNFPNPEGVSLSEAYENWAANFGFPLITAIRDYDRGFVSVSQNRFIHTNMNSEVIPAVNFFVPLKFATATSPNGDETIGLTWVTPNEPSKEFRYNPDSWLLVNPNAFGYYRVHYDDDNWIKLSNALHTTNSISSSSRVQLIDDIMTLARFGRVSYSIALNLITYIKAETSHTPVIIALGQLRDLTRNLRGTQVNIRGLNEDILNYLYKTINGNTAPTHVGKLLEAEVKNFACKHEYSTCIEESHVHFVGYVVNGTVEADLRKSMFCGSVQSASGAQEKFSEVFTIWTRLAKSEYDRVLNERHIIDILDAFSCLRNVEYMQEMLTYSLRNDVGIFMTTGDRLKILTSIVSGSAEGTGLALQMLRNNWAVASQRYGSAAAIYSVLGPNVITPEHVTIFNEIVFSHMRSNRAMETAEPVSYQAAMSAVRQVEENVQFITNHRDQLTVWFEKNYPGSSAALSSARLVLVLAALSVLCLLF